MKKTALSSFFALYLLFVLTSCEKQEVEKKKFVNGIHLNVLQDVITLDPRKGADYISGSIQYLLFEGLMRMTPDSVSSPAIADKIDVSEDGLTYTFHLRNSKWSNGLPITAYDFSQTWLDMLNPNFPAPNVHLLYPIKNAEKAKRGVVSQNEVGIKVLNYNTIEVTLETPTPYFKELITFCVFYPVCQHTALENEGWALENEGGFVGNGPYRLAKRRPGREIILEKNPFYWDAKSVELEQISISIVDNESTALHLYNNNELDLIGLPFRGIPSDSIPDLLDKGLIETTDVPASTICCFNMDKYPFNNKNIRKAFAYSIDRKSLVDNITQIGETPGVDLLPESLLSNQPEPFFKDGDVESAQKFLALGLKELKITIDDLPKLTLLHSTTGNSPKIAQALQDQWRRALGITVLLSSEEYKVYLDKLGTKDFDISQCVWIAQYPDPMNILDRFRIKTNTKNIPGYSNEEYSNILESSMYYLNKEERFELLKKALLILNDDVPLTALYHWKNPYMKKKHVDGLVVDKWGFSYLTGIKVNEKKVPENRPVLASVN